MSGDISKLSGEEFVSRYGSAPLQDDKKPSIKVDGCVGCSRIHCGVTTEIQCLRETIRAMRRAASAKVGP